MYLRYTGQFSEFEGQELEAIMYGFPLVGDVCMLTFDALEVLSGRTWSDLDAIARRIESVIAQYVGSDPEEIVATEWTPDQAASVRNAMGDLDVWLHAGGEGAPATRESEMVPSDVTRAEYLAVLALWKTVQLRDLTRAMLDALREPPEHDGASYPRGAASALLRFPEVPDVAAELARASTLALEAEYLAERIKGATGAIAKALDDMFKQQLRERGAKGGRSKAEAYRPSRERILQMYREGGFTGSRAAAADAIFDSLRKRGEEVPHSRVVRTLEAEDRRMREEREAKGQLSSSAPETPSN